MHRDLPLLSTETVATAVGVLAAITDAHALTKTQRERLQSAYESIGAFLAEHADFKDVTIEVHPQGSMLIGTTTRPEGKIEIDIDLVVLLIQGYHTQVPCKELLTRLLSALKEYAEQHDLRIQPKRRCVQLQYTGEMHADTTPVVYDPQARPYGRTHSLVPDRELLQYLSTNPKGFAAWFEDAAARMPSFSLFRALKDLSARADVVPLPSAAIFNRLLARIVQIFKIHRNIYFAQRDFCPPSAFLTTIIVQGYIAALRHGFDSPLDLILHIWQAMPNHIDRVSLSDGRETWVVNNPTAEGDNLADRIDTLERQSAIRAWHQKFGEDFLQLIAAVQHPAGIDSISAEIKRSYGARSAQGLTSAMIAYAAQEREKQRIHVPAMAGPIATGALSAPSIAMTSQPNRFYGGEETW
jgi:hypothetical protein